MRDMNPGKIPVALIALDRTMFQTGFGGKKARPLFRILGYKLRDQLNPQNLLTDETKAPPTLAEEMNDEIPDYGNEKDSAAAPPAAENKKATAPPARPTARREIKKAPAKTAARSASRKRLSNLEAG
jgi:hypothetical protein